MSRVFNCACLPSLYKSWTKWIWDYAEHDEVWLIARLIWAAKKANGLPKLPKDVWNLIVYQVFYGRIINNPKKWGNNVMKWMEYWITHPDQQRFVPLAVLDSGGHHPYTHYKDSGQDQMADLQYVSWNTYYFGKRVEYRVTRFAEFFVGICMDNVEDIEDCYMKIGKYRIHTAFQFLPQYTAYTAQHKFYYNPELPVVPMAALQWDDVDIVVTYKTNITDHQIGLVYVFSDKADLPTRDYILGYTANPFYITQGCGVYRYNNVEVTKEDLEKRI